MMTITLRATVALLAAIVLSMTLAAGAVYAKKEKEDELFTPPIGIGFTSNQMQCLIVNIDDVPRDVIIEAMDVNGTVVGTLDVVDLGPGRTRFLVVLGTSVPLPPIRCKFTVEGRRKNFRASILLFQPGVGAISTLPAE